MVIELDREFVEGTCIFDQMCDTVIVDQYWDSHGEKIYNDKYPRLEYHGVRVEVCRDIYKYDNILDEEVVMYIDGKLLDNFIMGYRFVDGVLYVNAPYGRG